MYHVKQDKREQKSADQLVAAAERIILNRQPQKLTVTLICKESGVARSTFYRLFDTPDDLLQFGADRILDSVVKGYVDLIERAEAHNLAVPSPVRWYAESFLKHKDLVAGMLRNGNGSILMNAHKKALFTYADVLFPDLTVGTDEFTFFVEMRSATLLGALSAWVATGQKATIEDIERYAGRQMKFLAGD